MQESISSSTYYASYLLRLRWSQQAGEEVCQIMLIHVATGEQHYFADLSRLVAYLQQPRRAEKGEPSDSM